MTPSDTANSDKASTGGYKRVPGMLTAKYAQLASQFGLTLPEIYNLTPRQIDEVYFHPRDEQGEIVVPRQRSESTDVAARIQQLLSLAPLLKIPKAKQEELKRRLEAELNGNPAGNP